MNLSDQKKVLEVIRVENADFTVSWDRIIWRELSEEIKRAGSSNRSGIQDPHDLKKKDHANLRKKEPKKKEPVKKKTTQKRPSGTGI